ncbi:MAG: 50S ribosomal protein L6 [Bacteroidales bacterium]|nr:50S ribosomal protein L6 [Bacteroidales bacterium]MBK7173539.1 50S ribosomal protein L6 [Bacteroidales bacterium]
MSRIGKRPIAIPSGVQITVSDKNLVTIKGKKGQLVQQVDPDIIIKVEGTELLVQRPTDQQKHRALHGLYRSLLANMVTGVHDGFTVVQELVGVGYKAAATGQILELSLGYSHNIVFELPAEIQITTVTERSKNPTITMVSHDKQLLGQVAAKIRSLRKPEPYKGKGIKFQGEILKRKAGKSASDK